MKTIKELEEIRKRTLENINLRKGREGYRIVVGMATCGTVSYTHLDVYKRQGYYFGH